MPRTGLLRPYAILIWLAALVFVLDQAVKALIVHVMAPAQVISVIPGFFDLVNIRNRGAAFGFLNRPDIEWQFWLFLCATCVAVWAIAALARQARNNKALLAGLGLVLGGALGNLLDRLRCRAVVDYLDFYVGSWHWPAFNVADMGICFGVFVVCITTLRKPHGSRP